MKIALGSDHRGFDVVERVVTVLRDERCEVETMCACDGRSCDYPDAAYPVATAVATGRCDRGILICGSGIGMSIAANKVKGVRAAVVHDEVGAEMSRRHNDANVLCLAADLTSGRTLEQIVQAWVRCDFEGGRHERRIRKITAIEAGQDPSTVDAARGSTSVGVEGGDAVRSTTG